MKKKYLYMILGTLLFLALVYFSMRQNNTDYETEIVIDSTTNLFSRFGHFLDKMVSYVVKKIFYIINLILEFIFGI